MMSSIVSLSGKERVLYKILLCISSQTELWPSPLTAFTDLRWNNIGLLGGRSLLEALQKNKRVVELEMAGNNIPGDTLRALGKSCVVMPFCFNDLKGNPLYQDSAVYSNNTSVILK